MSITARRTIIIIAIILLQACISSPEPAPEILPETTQVPDNTDILQAEVDLERARLAFAEWSVRELSIQPLPMTLGEILEVARSKQESGDIMEASRLALKVSKFSQLGLKQALKHQQSRPHYPQ